MRSECKKFGENSRQMTPVSTICDEYCRLKANEESRELDPFVSDQNNYAERFVTYLPV